MTVFEADMGAYKEEPHGRSQRQLYATASFDAPSIRGKINVNILPCRKLSQRALLIWPRSSCKSSSDFIWSSSSSHSASTHSVSVAIVMARAFLIRR